MERAFGDREPTTAEDPPLGANHGDRQNQQRQRPHDPTENRMPWRRDTKMSFGRDQAKGQSREYKRGWHLERKTGDPRTDERHERPRRGGCRSA